MTPTIGLCIEQTLGHRTHGANLAAYARSVNYRAMTIPVDYSPGRVPWALSGSWQAYRRLTARAPFDVTLFHTQTVSLLAGAASRGRPYVVSVDATPRQMDSLGVWYSHATQPGLVERTKLGWYRRVIKHAAAVVCWSAWAADSVVREYDGNPESILVAHPGAASAFFGIERSAAPTDRPVILFVGGDFERKGGRDLLDAFEPLAGRASLVLVTSEAVAAPAGVRVETAVQANSDRLLRLYQEADVFCLPTHGDCTPVVLGEAMAAGLPVVTTRVGSNEETVSEAIDGYLVNVGDVSQLGERLGALVDDATLRTTMGLRARERARDVFDSQKNAAQIFERLISLAAQSGGTR